MIIELIVGWLIGKFVAKNKKMAVIMGAAFGAVWGIMIVNFLLTAKGDAVSLPLMLIISTAEALIAALMAGIVVHAKMQKQARQMQAFPD